MTPECRLLEAQAELVAAGFDPVAKAADGSLGGLVDAWRRNMRGALAELNDQCSAIQVHQAGLGDLLSELEADAGRPGRPTKLIDQNLQSSPQSPVWAISRRGAAMLGCVQ